MSHTYVTISTLLKARFRKTDGPGAPSCCPHFYDSGPANAVREEVLAQARLPEALINFLLEMDRKLDTILGRLQGESVAEDFPFEGRVSSLSAETLVLETAEPLRGGEYVELLLFLEEFPLRPVAVTAEATGPALRAAPSAAGAEQPGAPYAMRYTCMNEEYRESIIRFIFQEERRRIRLQKGLADRESSSSKST